MGYTAEQRETMFKNVLNRLVKGESLRVILNDKGTPSRLAFYDWLEKDVKKQERFARACQIGDEMLFEETIEIARKPIIETIQSDGSIGDTVTTNTTTKDNVQRSKLIIETIDKVLARRNPRKYGNKLDVTSDNQAISIPAIVGMVIKNEITPDDSDPAADENYSDLL